MVNRFRSLLTIKKFNGKLFKANLQFKEKIKLRIITIYMNANIEEKT
jgi:hypothetical protein